MRKKILFVSIFSLFISKSIFADKNGQILTQGKNVYVINCSMCHGKDGLGRGPLGVNLTVENSPDKKLQPLKMVSEKQILEKLNGKKIDLMPDFRTSLSADEKEAVAKYIMEALSQKK
jgi:mono/diheme cytochrome c family protein